MNIGFKSGIILISCLISLFSSVARAASLNVVANRSSINVGQLVLVNVALDTQGEDVNAIQGTVTFPSSTFSFAGIQDGSSPVLLWIQPPQESASGTVSFSGIMPGGFEGQASSVVGIVLNPVSGGTGVVTMNDAEVLRNDGQGSSVPLSVSNWAFIVGGVAGATTSSSGTLAPSTPFTVPENFAPTIARNPNVYNGNYFLVFETTDKGSGVSHYDVAEIPAGSVLGANSPWTQAMSPYLLKDQSLSSDIYVRAINYAGNATIAKVPARHPPASATKTYWDIIVVLSLLGFLLLVVMIVIFERRRIMK